MNIFNFGNSELNANIDLLKKIDIKIKSIVGKEKITKTSLKNLESLFKTFETFKEFAKTTLPPIVLLNKQKYNFFYNTTSIYI